MNTENPDLKILIDEEKSVSMAIPATEEKCKVQIILFNVSFFFFLYLLYLYKVVVFGCISIVIVVYYIMW